MNQHNIVHVALPARSVDRSYDIVIGDELLPQTGNLVAQRLGKRRCIIVSDTTVAGLYLNVVQNSLTAAGHECGTPIIIPPGEGSKTFTQFNAMAETALDQHPDRRTLIVALGGGVIGDMAGMLAALLLRGVDFIQLPTTLLAQVDSSVGGKTGIDTPQGKNLLGAFHQPRLVLADSAVLRSLPRRQLAAGFAETVKYGLINQPEFFDWCVNHGPALLSGDNDTLTEAVRRSCTAKAAIVVADEHEAGQRALLNLGHTFGHALEAVCGFGDTLFHGEAVAIGCALALRFSFRQGICPPDALRRYLALCAACALPTTPPVTAASIPQLMEFMKGDKKNRDGAITLILLRDIGQAFIAPNIAAEIVEAFWQEQLKHD